MSNNNISKLIFNICNKNSTLSESWKNMTKNLQHYLEYENIDLYKINNIHPQIFHFPEYSIQNINQLEILEKDKESIFYKILLNNNYGPEGIRLYNNIQLDRVQQTWSIYILVEKLMMDIRNSEIIFEFGGGTGQMVDVLSCLGFKGTHIIYDLPLITILQSYFVSKRDIDYSFLIDDKEISINNSVYYLPSNQDISEKNIMKLPNINFIATYSLSESDINTRNRFADYMINFARIYIVYWPGKNPVGDNIDNDEYIQSIQLQLDNTHYYHICDNYGNGKAFMAIKKDIALSKDIFKL